MRAGEAISSGQNPKIKELLALQEKSRLRRQKGLFVVEGRRELGHCVRAGFEVDSVFACPDIIAPESLDIPGDPRLFLVTKAVYEKVAYRESTEGVIAEVKYKERTLADIRLGEKPLIIILESVEKPGNLGAVLRSADAAGADAVIVCDPLTDLCNPNLIRASVGSVFTRQVVATSSEECVKWLKGKGIQILTAQLQDSSLYYDRDMTGPTAIVMGTESTGLTDIWREAATAHVRIPMLGELDSLNVSVSAAILLFEAVRQRQAKL